MPCRYDPTPEEEAQWAREARKKQEKEFEHNSRVAELLCAVMGVLETTDKKSELYDHLVSKQITALDTWWEKHKERDRVKARAEKCKFNRDAERERALLKLTPKEKKLLGIK